MYRSVYIFQYVQQYAIVHIDFLPFYFVFQPTGHTGHSYNIQVTGLIQTMHRLPPTCLKWDDEKLWPAASLNTYSLEEWISGTYTVLFKYLHDIPGSWIMKSYTVHSKKLK